MIPIADCHGQKGSGDVGKDIVVVKVTAIWQYTLDDFRSEAKGKRANNKGKLENTPAISFENPVE